MQVSVNGGAVQNFDVTANTGGCVTTSSITCTETVLAPVGTDSFVVNTFSATGGGGAQLDTGTSSLTVLNNTANNFGITLHPVVSTNASTNTPGSLSYAIANASNGDLITFTSTVGPSITVTAQIPINGTNLSITGPGSANLTISGGGTSQLFLVNTIPQLR